MAYSKAMSRLCSRFQPLSLKLNKNGSSSASVDVSVFKSSSQPQASASVRRNPRISRLPMELSSLETMMPLHSAIASARLQSSLSMESQEWGLIPQGISLPL